jgi:hypothetical protein
MRTCTCVHHRGGGDLVLSCGAFTGNAVHTNTTHKLFHGKILLIFEFYCSFLGWNSSVCIATRYRLDSRGTESLWGRDFPHLSRPALGPHPASYTMGTGSFWGLKWPVHGVDHPPHLAPRLKKE